MKIKNFILVNTLILQLSCGYKLANNISDYKFKISDYELKGDKKVNNILERNFKRLQNPDDFSKIFKLNINNTVNRTIMSKDTSGNALTYKLEVKVDIEVLNNENSINKISFIEKTDYNNTDSKFELKQYEDILIQDLMDQIIVKINNYLSSI